MSAVPAPVWTSTLHTRPLAPGTAGAGIDLPAPDQRGDGWSLTIAGWVVGQTTPASEIHVVLDGRLVRRGLVEVERPDVGELFPGCPGAHAAGFRVHVGVLGLPAVARLEVVAVLGDTSPAHLATIEVRHGPLATPYSPRLSPITVTSLGRMGTTWLMRLLAHHPEVVVHPQYPYELGMGKYWAHLLAVAAAPADHAGSAHPETITFDPATIGHNPYFGDFLAGSPHLERWLGSRSPSLVGGCAQQALDEFYSEVAQATGVTGARFFAEKGLPDHVPEVLGDLYPAGRELILVRDIRDVICSALAFDAKRGRRSFGRESLEDDLAFVSQLQMDLGRLVRSWERRRGTALLVRYEQLISSPEATLNQILRYLGLDCSPKIVAAVLDGASTTTPQLAAHRTTASPEASIGRWRTDLVKIHPGLPERCAALLSPLLDQLGYSTTQPRSHRMEREVAAALGRLDRPVAPADA